ncbi:MAG: hypothetical protein HUJ65_07535, partial [Oscillospiraceae bacterium]|nr:hypothetical protein [Oscillospiraceae bacterium]
DKFEKECACKAAKELSVEDVENIAGGFDIEKITQNKVSGKPIDFDKVSPETVEKVVDYMGQYNS